MPPLSTTPVAIMAGSKITNTGSGRIFFDRQPSPSLQRHIGHIESGVTYTTFDDIYIIAPSGDTTYSLGQARQPAAWSVQGPWSVASTYAKGDVVTWAGSSFVALNDVAAGGTPPAADPTNWFLVVKGTAPIATARYTGAQLTPGNNIVTDIPGVQIVVPAHSGPIDLECQMPIRHTTAAVANGNFLTTAIIYDVTAGNTNIAQFTYRTNLAPINQANEETLRGTYQGAILDQTVDKTYKLSIFAQFVNGSVIVLAPGSGSALPATWLRALPS